MIGILKIIGSTAAVAVTLGATVYGAVKGIANGKKTSKANGGSEEEEGSEAAARTEKENEKFQAALNEDPYDIPDEELLKDG